MSERHTPSGKWRWQIALGLPVLLLLAAVVSVDVRQAQRRKRLLEEVDRLAARVRPVPVVIGSPIEADAMAGYQEAIALLPDIAIAATGRSLPTDDFEPLRRDYYFAAVRRAAGVEECACDALCPTHWFDLLPDAGQPTPGCASPEPNLDALLAATRTAIVRFREAARSTHVSLRFSYLEASWWHGYASYWGADQLLATVLLDAHKKGAEGKPAVAMDLYLDAVRWGVDAHQIPSLWVWRSARGRLRAPLTGLSRFCAELARAAPVERPVSADDVRVQILRTALEGLDRLESALPPVGYACLAERLAWEAETSGVQEIDVDGDWLRGAIIAILLPIRGGTLVRLSRRREEIDERVDPVKAAAEFDALGKALGDAWDGIDLKGGGGGGCFGISTVGPPHETTELRVRFRATRVLAAAALYRLLHGRYPQRPEQLVPEILDAIPVDPYRADGGTLRYATLDAEWPLRVWSVGLDGVDDGGKASEDVFGQSWCLSTPPGGRDLIYALEGYPRSDVECPDHSERAKCR